LDSIRETISKTRSADQNFASSRPLLKLVVPSFPSIRYPLLVMCFRCWVCFMVTVSITWANAHQHGEAWISHHRLRYRMFVERQKWTVPSYNQIEYDEFDTPAATYILTVDEHYRTLGTMRLIPTTRPYMVESLWPALVDTELPHCDSVWEASRFCCDRDLDAASRRQVVAQSILGCLEFGIANGISKYLGVMPVQIFKNVIAANQCPVDRAGPTLRQSGHSIAAAYIDVSPSILEAVRRHTGIRTAVLEPEMATVA
jgi:N-acyl-L-homoserine lactone synthetase